MKKLILVFFLLLQNICFGQIGGTIIDSETKEKVPYVNIWIENENIGTTSDKNGIFELDIKSSKTIIFSAVGFETKKT